MIRLLLLGLVAGLAWYALFSWRRSRREDELARARAAFFVQPKAPPVSRRELPPLREVRLADGYHLSYCWELWAPRPDRGPLVAAFAFRVPSEALDAITEDDVRLLEREIREASLSSQPEPS